MVKNKKNYITILTVLSCLAVVGLHTNNYVFWNFCHSRKWIISNIFESVLYFAVPIFFMISGATLIDFRDKYDLKVFFKKRILKTVIPYVFWSIFAMFWCWFYLNIYNDFDFKSIFNNLVNNVYNGKYWFFTTLFSIYLAIPFISCINKKERKSIFKYIIIVGFIVNSLLPFVLGFFGLSVNNDFKLFISFDYLIYVFIGYYIDNYNIEKKYRILVYILSICGLLTHILGTQFLSFNDGSLNLLFKGYTNVPCVLYSSGIFLFMKNCDFSNIPNLLNKIVLCIAKYSFGIYLIHSYILEFLIYTLKWNYTTILFKIGTIPSIVFIAIIIIFIIRKIPILKRIIPE